MPLEGPLAPLNERVADLNARHRHHSAHDVTRAALGDPLLGPLALVSSFGAESVVLLHMISVLDRTTPVLFLDTGMLFEETLTYQLDLTGRLGLADVRRIRPDWLEVSRDDADRTLHQRDADTCCALRKVRPLETALAPLGGWITGRKRFHGGRRASLEFFESDGHRVKINPLAHWTREDVADYIDNNRLPRHPLVARGFPSIGCAPCTSRAAPGEDPRAGRWRNSAKTECGIHFEGGGAVRTHEAPA